MSVDEKVATHERAMVLGPTLEAVGAFILIGTSSAVTVTHEEYVVPKPTLFLGRTRHFCVDPEGNTVALV